VAIVTVKILERRCEEMKFLVKPINNKFEGYCYCPGQCGCNGQGGGGGGGGCNAEVVPIYAYCPRRG